VEKEVREARRSVRDELPAELLAPMQERQQPVRKPVTTAPESFGAPIAAPVLDPQRHGG
jgi:hypothetical protein